MWLRAWPANAVLCVALSTNAPLLPVGVLASQSALVSPVFLAMRPT